MEHLAQVLEEEFDEAITNNNKKSLHRAITILLDNIAEKKAVDKQLLEIRMEIKVLSETMKTGFENTNKRFDDMNKRFDDMNKRFDDMNKHFTALTWFMGVGFSLISLLIAIIKIFG